MLVAASDLEVADDLKKYDLKMTHNIPDPWTMQVDESFILEFVITNTNPVTNLEFDIGEMLGHADAVTFGKPAVSFGEAYRHDDPVDTAEFEGKLIHLDPVVSNTGVYYSTEKGPINPNFQASLSKGESSGYLHFLTRKQRVMWLMLTIRSKFTSSWVFSDPTLLR